MKTALSLFVRSFVSNSNSSWLNFRQPFPGWGDLRNAASSGRGWAISVLQEAGAFASG
jgi:hypothetical protein